MREGLDYAPGVLTIKRNIRGKWARAHCQTLIQALVPAQVIDKGIPTAWLLAQVLVATFLDHQPLYRQEGPFARDGSAVPRSTLAQRASACGVHAVHATPACVACDRLLEVSDATDRALDPGFELALEAPVG